MNIQPPLVRNASILASSEQFRPHLAEISRVARKRCSAHVSGILFGRVSADYIERMRDARCCVAQMFASRLFARGAKIIPQTELQWPSSETKLCEPDISSPPPVINAVASISQSSARGMVLYGDIVIALTHEGAPPLSRTRSTKGPQRPHS